MFLLFRSISAIRSMDAAKGARRTWMSGCTGASLKNNSATKYLDKLIHRSRNTLKYDLSLPPRPSLKMKKMEKTK